MSGILPEAILELRTGARRTYLMAAELRAALGLPPRLSLMPEEPPEPGLCQYCGAPCRNSYCGSTCAWNAGGLRRLESGAQGGHRSAPHGSEVDFAEKQRLFQKAARFLAAGVEWRIVADELGLDATACAKGGADYAAAKRALAEMRRAS